MLQLIPKILAFQIFRRFGRPRLSPLNLTVSLTCRCNSRCKTCNIYKIKKTEFSLEEFDRTFQSIGRSPLWLTLSGGEPFLRKDIVEICESAYRNCRPKIINIPTNGILSNIIPERVERIAQNCPDTRIIVNLSLDETGTEHDKIRNVKNNFTHALETFNRLKLLDQPNLTIGIHTVISRYNVKNFVNIYESLNSLNPDSYITEIAEERVELGTIDKRISPSVDDYAVAVDFLMKKMKQKQYKGISIITQAFRLQYYKMVKKVLAEKRQVLSCYAGFMSAQIAPDGEVWACCIKADSMGNLGAAGYDFKKVWFSKKAESVRRTIRENKCYCPLANAGYTNMLASFRTMAAVLKNIVFGIFRKNV